MRNKRTAFAATLCMELANALLVRSAPMKSQVIVLLTVLCQTFDHVEDAVRFFDSAASLFDEVQSVQTKQCHVTSFICDFLRARWPDTTPTRPCWSATYASRLRNKCTDSSFARS